MTREATVLVVDDSLTVRMDLAEAFAQAGFRVRTCASAGEARAAWTSAATDGSIDVVVLDVLLPDADGVELLREIRTLPSGAECVVLMLSSEAEVKDRIRGLGTGADEFVGKPYDRGHVVARARDLLRARRVEDASPHPTVLVVDDSATALEQLRVAFEGAGYDALTATNGEEALRIAADRRPSAMVVDGVLPGMDGATVIRRVRLDAALRGMPCLLLTAQGDRAAELRALDAGADAFVRKEEPIELVLARVAAILRRGRPEPRAETTASLVGPKRILAVDDSLTYLEALASALRDDGFDVVLAHSGEEAIELLAVQPVDCILLDLMMPGLSGQETCRRIKSALVVREVPLIMLTACEDRGAMIEGLGAGADDYIAKSSEFDVLRARVRAQIRRRQFEDENRRIRDELHHKAIEAAEAREARAVAETRARLADDLQRANADLEAFSYSVSHDLRAPLRSIAGFSEILDEDYASALDAKGREHLRRIRAAARRMGELVDDLLQLSRIGRGEFARRPVDVGRLARSIAADLERADPSRSVAFSAADGLVVDADERLVRVLLENLLGNSWKFTSKRRDAAVEVGARPCDGATACFVRDNGSGFDLTRATKLFQPFQRMHVESDFPGTGIGLATVRRIVECHRGRVWAESAVGRGTTIWFTLGPPAPTPAPAPVEALVAG